jgi:hypothetical protein
MAGRGGVAVLELILATATVACTQLPNYPMRVVAAMAVPNVLASSRPWTGVKGVFMRVMHVIGT